MKTRILIAALLMAISTAESFAAPNNPPQTLSFAGYFADKSTGNGLDGTYDMKFQLSGGGTAFWCAQYSVQIVKGNAVVTLGSTDNTGQLMTSDCSSTAAGSIAINSSSMSGVSSFTPTTLTVMIKNSSSTFETLSPSINISSSPFALYAESLGGILPTGFATFTTSGNLLSKNGTAVIDTSGNWIGPAPTFSGSTNMGGNRVLNVGTPTANTDAVTKSYNDGNLAGRPLASPSPSSGQTLQYNGTSWVFTNAGTGTVSSLNGIGSATQTFASSDITIASSGGVHSFTIPTASASIRGLLSSSDWTTFNNKAAWTFTPVNKAGDTMTGILTLPSLILGSATNTVNLTSSGSGGALTFTLPSVLGTGGQVLTTNGSGVLSWTTPTSGTITSVVGGTGITATSGGGIATMSLAIATNGSLGGLRATTGKLSLDGSTGAITNVVANAADFATTADSANKLQSIPVTSASPSSGQVLAYDSTNSQWAPRSPSGLGSFTIGSTSLSLGGTATSLTGLSAVSISGSATPLNVTVDGAGSQILARFQNSDNATTSYSRLVFSTAGTNWNAGIAGGGASSDARLAFSVSSSGNTWSEKMGITPTGVLINGSSSSRSALDLASGAMSLPASSSPGNSVNNWLGTGDVGAAFYGSSAVELGVANSPKLVVKSTGNVGIGTTNPAQTLDVVGSIRLGDASNNSTLSAPASGGALTFTLPNSIGSNGQVLAASGSGTLTWTTPAGALGFTPVNKVGDTMTGALSAPSLSVTSNTFSVNSSSLYVNSSGNVGIGTTSPGTNLEVADASNPKIYLNRNGTKYFLSGTASSLDFGNEGVATKTIRFMPDNTEKAKIDSSGLTLSGDMRLLKTDSSEIWHTSGGAGSDYGRLILAAGGGSTSTSKTSIQLEGWSTFSTPHYIAFSTLGSERMRIISDGKIGIGTTAPAQLLDVNGTAKATNLEATTLLQLDGSTSGAAGLKAAATSAVTWTLPGSDGSNGQVLSTNGSGILTWSSSGLTFTPVNKAGDTMTGSLFLQNDDSTTFNHIISLRKSVSNGAVANGNELGYLEFRGKSSSTYSRAAYIVSNVDGTVSSFTPGRLVFVTTSSTGTETEAMRITSSGNVGIGTNTPSNRLHVNGEAKFANGINFGSSAGTIPSAHSDGTSVYINANTGNIMLRPNGFSSTGAATLNTAGKLTIDGTAASAGIDLATNDRYLNARVIQNTTGSTDKHLYLNYGADSTSQTKIYGGGGEKITVNSNGVGINTSADSNYSGLRVAGDIWSNSSNTGGGSICWGDPTLSGTMFRIVKCTSDARLKEDVHNLSSHQGLDAINKLRPVSYAWRDVGNAKSGRQLGFIAQEVETVLDGIVSKGGTTQIHLADGSTQDVPEVRNMNFNGFFAPIVKAIQELYAKFLNHDTRVEQLESENAAMKSYFCAKDPDAPFCIKK